MIELKGEQMPSLAQVWMDRGKEKWLQEGELKRLYQNIKMGLELKFNQINDRLFISITKIKEIKKLEKIQEAIFTINDINEFKIFVKKLNS